MMSFPVGTKFFHHITLGKTQITYSFPSSCTNTNQSSSMHHIQIFERGVMPTDGSNQKCLVFCLKSCHKEGKYSQNLSAARLLETSVKDTADRCLFFLIGTVAIAMGLKLGWETESWIKARCPRAPSVFGVGEVKEPKHIKPSGGWRKHERMMRGPFCVVSVAPRACLSSGSENQQLSFRRLIRWMITVWEWKGNRWHYRVFLIINTFGASCAQFAVFSMVSGFYKKTKTNDELIH